MAAFGAVVQQTMKDDHAEDNQQENVPGQPVEEDQPAQNNQQPAAEKPAEEPAEEPKQEPSKEPKQEPSKEPKQEPSKEPKQEPSKEPKQEPSKEPKQEQATADDARKEDRAKGDENPADEKQNEGEKIDGDHKEAWVGDEGDKKEKAESEATGGGADSEVDEAAEEAKILSKKLPLNFLEREMGNDVRDGYLESHFALASLKDTFMYERYPGNHDQNNTVWDALQNGDDIMMSPDKKFMDIANMGDWNDWFKRTVELVWNCGDLAKQSPPTVSNDNGTGIPMAQKSQLYLMGALRLRTQRVHNGSCVISPDVLVNPAEFPSRYNLTDFQCWMEHKDRYEQKWSPWCNFTNPINGSENLYRYYEPGEAGGQVTTTEQGAYDSGGYIVEIPFTASCAKALEFVDLVQNPSCQFVDNWATRFVIVELFAYQPAIDVHYSVKLINEVTAGGSWIPVDQFRAFVVMNSERSTNIVTDFIFLIFVFYYTINFIRDFKAFKREEGRILKFFLDIWVVMELVNLLMYYLVFCLRWAWWSYSNQQHRTFPYEDRYYAGFDTIVWLYSQQRYVLAVNFIITFMKILKYLKISQKLNIIALTFEVAKADVMGLLILFLVVVTGYSIAGMALYGANLYGFSTMDRSFSNLMQMLLGQMDYMAMKKINPVLTGFFFWTYLIVSFFLLLNFIVGVIGNSFNAAGEQQWTCDLSDAALLTVDSTLAQLKPKNIKRHFILWFKRKKTLLYLRSQVLGYLKQNHSFLRLKYPNLLEIEVPGSDLLKWLPPNERREYEPFIAQDWKEFAALYQLQFQSSEEQLDRQRREVIAEGARAALKPVEGHFVALDEKISEVEDTAYRVLAALQRKTGNASISVKRPLKASERPSSRGDSLSPSHQRRSISQEL